MTGKPVLLLDVMSTLVTEPFFERVPSFFGMTLPELFAAKHPTSWIEFEHGQIDENAYLSRFFADGRKVDGVGFKQMMVDAFEFMEGVEPLLVELQGRGFEMHALSNYPAWYQLIEDKLTLSRFLSWSFVSCHTGVRKPDPESYLGAARTLGISPEQCVFVDDREKNVSAARTVGMKTILRTEDIQAFRRDLARLGILG